MAAASSSAPADSDAQSPVGTLTIAFSYPVRNPVLHLEGIGALAVDGAGATAFASTYTLEPAASGGAGLGAVSPGATDLSTTGDTIAAANSFPGTSCASVADGGLTAAATAGCGSVPIVGTVTSADVRCGHRRHHRRGQRLGRHQR